MQNLPWNIIIYNINSTLSHIASADRLNQSHDNNLDQSQQSVDEEAGVEADNNQVRFVFKFIAENCRAIFTVIIKIENSLKKLMRRFTCQRETFMNKNFA